MGLLTPTTTFTRFRLVESVPDELWREIPSRLVQRAFIDIDQTTDERSSGWVSFDNFLDPAWRTAPPEKGEYFAFALRLDTRHIAPAVFRKHFRLALDQAAAEGQEQGRRFLSREQKKEIREQVRFRLMARTLPVPAVFDVIWNRRTGVVYLGSVRSKVRDLFMEHFTFTFGLHLERLTPAPLAAGLLDEAGRRRLEHVEPASFSA